MMDEVKVQELKISQVVSIPQDKEKLRTLWDYLKENKAFYSITNFLKHHL